MIRRSEDLRWLHLLGANPGKRIADELELKSMNRFIQTNRGLARSSLLLLFVCVAIRSFGDALDNWAWRSPLPQGNDLNGVAYGDGQFVAVGNAGPILRSPDGQAGEVVSQTAGRNLLSASYGQGKFVIVGDSGAVLTSADGVQWISRASGVGSDLRVVSYLNGVFVAAGRAGAIITSSDGKNWSIPNSGTDYDLSGVAYGNGTFTVVGYRCGSIACYEGVILGSTDAIHWNQRSFSPNAAFYSVAYGKEIFVAVGSNGSDTGPDGTIYTSTDGVNWGQSLNDRNDQWSAMGALMYDKGIFVAAGSSVLASPDGVNWTPHDLGPYDAIRALAYGHSRFTNQ